MKILNLSASLMMMCTGQTDMVLIGHDILRSPYWPLAAARELGQTASWPMQYPRATPPGSTGR